MRIQYLSESRPKPTGDFHHSSALDMKDWLPGNTATEALRPQSLHAKTEA
jgi:hypothetical protein